MKVRLRDVKDAGIIENERVVLRVRTATNIGQYLIGSTIYEQAGTVAATLENIYWFPDTEVAEGDFVILYTKRGEPKRALNKSRTTNHYFYWGLQSPIWAEAESAPVLFEAPQWMATRSHPVSESTT